MLKAESPLHSVPAPKGGKEPTVVPWEFRINKFPEVTLTSSTGSQRYNYWHAQKEGDREFVVVGYHGVKETSGEFELGQFMTIGKDRYLLLLSPVKRKKEAIAAVLKSVLEGMKNKNLVVSVLSEEELAAKTGTERLAA